MTRSELLEKAIERIETITLRQKASEYGVTYYHDPLPIDQYELILSLLLAEQKRSEGCAFCRNKENEHGFFIDGNVLFYEDGKLGTEGIIITTCPHCGRDLTEGESV